MNKASLITAALSALVQYYDYHLFGFLAAKIAKNFLPANQPLTVLLKTYLMMYLAVLLKPLGSVFLGHIGDVYGRQVAIHIGLVATACASFILGIMPSYDYIGFLAPILILMARVCVVTFVSSGTDGIRIYAYESLSQKRKNLSSSLVTISSVAGSFIASLSALFVTLETMPEYFWRVSFILGSLAGIGVIRLRQKFNCINLDASLKKEIDYDRYKKTPIIRIIKENLTFVCLGTILAGGVGASYHFNFLFFGVYNFEVLRIISASKMQLYISGGIATYALCSVIGGVIADIINPKVVVSISALIIIILNIMQCYQMNENRLSIWIYFCTSALLPLINIPCLTLLKSSISKVVRHRLFSLVHSLGSITISASTPVISTWLYSKTQTTWLPTIYFMIILLLMTLVLNLLLYLKPQSTEKLPLSTRSSTE